MDSKVFADAFAKLTDIKSNPFHPLVWITGSPEIGKNVYIGGFSEVNAKDCKVIIGDYCDIASFVSINAADSHKKSIGISNEVERKNIHIENHVFIGSHCVIKGGAEIGHHSVIAAGTIVDGKKIPPYSLVLGNPMIIKPNYYSPKISNEPIPHNRPTLGQSEEIATTQTLRSGWLAQGKKVKEFEERFATLFGLNPKNAVAVSSGTASLFLALRALNAKKKVVVLPVYSCAALPNACHFAQGISKFIDTSKDSPNIDLTQISGHANSISIAVMAHMFGIPQKLVRSKKIKIVEDCAQSLGATISGTPVGLMGDIGTFSFYATKMITSGGQGGMLISSNSDYAESVRDFREFDQRRDQQARFNLQMTDLQASVGIEQLKKLPEFIARRNEIFHIYQKAGLCLMNSPDSKVQSSCYRAILLTKNPKKILEKLKQNNIDCIIPIEEWELLSKSKLFPNAKKLTRTTLSLPIYPSLTNEQVNKIISVINSK